MSHFKGPCRVCLKPWNLHGSEFISLYIPMTSHDLTPGAMLSSIINRQILQHDGLPECVCKICFEKIVLAHELKIQCEHSEVVLKKYINNLCYPMIDLVTKSSMNKNDTILIVLPESNVLNEIDEKNDEESVRLKEYCIEENNIDRNKNEKLLGILLNNSSDRSNGSNIDINYVKPTDTEYFSNDEIVKCLKTATPIEFDSTLITNSTGDIQNDKNEIKYATPSKINRTFDCTMCNDKFTSKGELKLHKRQHPEGTKHFCKICFRSYRQRSTLNNHLKTHSGPKNYECTTCGKKFFHENSLKTHMVYHQEKRFTCSRCQANFFFNFALVEHMKTVHSFDLESDQKEETLENSNKLEIVKQHECSMCLETFTSKDDLNEHKKNHPENTRHACKLCGKSYLKFITLKRHLNKHTGKRSFLCTVCGVSFFYKNELNAHMIYHNEKKYECHICDKKFHIHHTLAEHVRINHSNEKYCFMCELCGKLCSTVGRLAIHRDSHNSYSCTTCGKRYRSSRYYRLHVKSHFEKSVPKKSFICDYCGENKSSKTTLALHILRNHLKERRFKCKVCGKGFFSKGTRNEHELVHSRNKMEKCNTCNRLLVSKKALILHNRIHTGEKPYSCDICGERFLSSSRRIMHQKSKHGERTEHCQLCTSKFYLRSDLNKHMLLHSREPKKLKRPAKEV